MKIRKGFVLRKICGQNVLCAEGMEQVNFNKLISLNESAMLVWQRFETADEFEESDIVDFLVETYEGLERERAQKDTAALCERWKELQLIDL